MDRAIVTEGRDGSKSGVNMTMIGAIVGAGALLLLVAVIIAVVVVRKRQRTFKGDYNTKKHVFGNGYGKAGVRPPGPQQLPYPESDEDHKLSSMNVSYENERKVVRDGADFDTDSKRPYFTVDESDTQEELDEQTLSFQYPPDLTEDMVSQNDGSIISKKEWYV